MAPDSDRRQISFPNLKYPIHRDTQPKIPSQWLRGKEAHDGAEGLWRVHDGLYDLTDYISIHPGGAAWLINTKGTDVTEAFETHHLKGIAESILRKYYVRNAIKPRNYPYTFDEDGFYKTLKLKVMDRLRSMPKDSGRNSETLTNYLVAALIVLSPVSCWAWTENNILGATLTLICGFVLSAIVTCGHNYSHRADNWRMYLTNLSGMCHDEWRISHAMSHHMHTNTIQDIELSLFEPSLQYLPAKDKPIWAQMGAFYWPIAFAMVFIFTTLQGFLGCLFRINGKSLKWSNFIIFILPTWMWLATGLSLKIIIPVWIGTLMVGSFFFTLFGLTAGHHAHVNFFEGDVPRMENIDWGVHQLDTIVERFENVGNDFKSLTRFGDHALHHLFPTLDHSELKYLYPILIEHCEKHEMQVRMTTFYGALISNCKQLIRKRPNNFKEKTYSTKRYMKMNEFDPKYS